jgi:membrane-associated protease RseP (regulator of RpoE activity)
VKIAAGFAVGVLFFVIMVVILTHTWSLKIVGITASTFATGMFVAGFVDVVSTTSPLPLLPPSPLLI